MAGVEHSQWREFKGDGSRLLRERGTLALAGVQLDVHCAGIEASAQWLGSRDTRAYDGQTDKSTPFQTDSRLRYERLQLQAWVPLQPAWAVGVQVRQDCLERRPLRVDHGVLHTGLEHALHHGREITVVALAAQRLLVQRPRQEGLHRLVRIEALSHRVVQPGVVQAHLRSLQQPCAPNRGTGPRYQLVRRAAAPGRRTEPQANAGSRK